MGSTDPDPDPESAGDPDPGTAGSTGDRSSTDPPSVAVVGSYNVGLTMTVPRFPVAGETVIGRDFAESGGGKGSNQAIAAARLGADAAFVGRIGEDAYGDHAMDLWDEEGVDASHVTRDSDAATGAGFVIVDDAGENEIVVAPGANHDLSGEHVILAADVVENADALLVQLEIDEDPVGTAVGLAGTADVPVVLNPAPAREVPERILRGVDYLTPNRGEARILAGHDPDADVEDEAVATDLLDLGVGTVVLTLGADGALIADGDGIERVPASDVDPVDTTGAGDAFSGALAVALAEGRSLADAVAFANAAGALACTAGEVIPALPERSAVEELLGAE